MLKIVFQALFFLCFTTSQAQTYTSYFTGDTSDVATAHLSGTVLAGGGSDNDQAMQWMLQRADGGDVVVIRVSGSDGYNDYFFSELGINVNSVETIKFHSAAAASDIYVNRRIREAEVLFIAGGDQSDYRDFWRNNPVSASINYLLSEKAATVGGTSAGMAILGGIYYAPENQSLISIEALSNPYHPNVDGLSGVPFLQTPFLANVVTDTHFEQRDRQGRSLVFLARARLIADGPAYNIACNESTAVAIDEQGIARVFGEYPNYDDYAFFMQAGCTNTSGGPEALTAGQPIVWEQNGQAVSVYRVPGTLTGNNTFDLNDWRTGSGGSWQYWTAASGQLHINNNGSEPVNCAPLAVQEGNLIPLTLYPQPADGRLFIEIQSASPQFQVQLFDVQGKMVLSQLCTSFPGVSIQTSAGVDVSSLPEGVYILRIPEKAIMRKVMVR